MSQKLNKQQLVCDYIQEQYVLPGRIRMDIVSGKVQLGQPSHDELSVSRDHSTTRWQDITNADINDIVCTISCERDVAVTSREVLAALQSHLVPHIHPLRDWLASLRPFCPDEIDYIGMLADHVRVVPAEGQTADEAQRFWQWCFRKWFVAMVAGWLTDDVVNHSVLVLIGRQGIYKTTWLEHLIPDELRAYSCKMASSPTGMTKDDRMRVAEFGLIQLDEIDAMGPRELNVLKSVITTTDINERQAYAYTKERRARLATFCASGNNREFLTDLTGSRRWLPFEVESILNPFDTRLPYTRLYAQALYLIHEGFAYWFENQEISALEQHNDDYREQENEEQLLQVYFDIPAEGAPSAKFLTTAEISDKLITYGNIKRPLSLTRLGILLSRAGYKCARSGTGGRTRGWIVYEKSGDEITAGRTIAARNMPDNQPLA